jgi:hypothetical protein
MNRRGVLDTPAARAKPGIGSKWRSCDISRAQAKLPTFIMWLSLVMNEEAKRKKEHA